AGNGADEPSPPREPARRRGADQQSKRANGIGHEAQEADAHGSHRRSGAARREALREKMITEYRYGFGHAPMKLRDDARFSTLCIHAGQEPDPSTGAIITPIYQTSTYVQEGLGQHKGFEYGRTQNPTRMALERNLAAIELGAAGFAFASGLAAIDAILT